MDKNLGVEKNIGLKDVLSKKNIKNFVDGNVNYLRSRTTFFKLPVHIQEQAIYRAANCFDCLQLGHCKICKCKLPEMFYSPDKVDEQGKWGAMLNMYDWAKFKKANNIVVDPKIDLAKMELNYEFSEENLDAMLPWELRQVMGDLYDSVSQMKSKEDEV